MSNAATRTRCQALMHRPLYSGQLLEHIRNDPPATAVTRRASVLQNWRWTVFEGQGGKPV